MKRTLSNWKHRIHQSYTFQNSVQSGMRKNYAGLFQILKTLQNNLGKIV